MTLIELRAFNSYAPRVLRYAGWLAGGLMAVAGFFALGILVRVLMGPVSLGPFSGQIHTALATELPGLDVRFDDAALVWTRSEGRINLVILGTRVYDREGRIIAQAPQAEIGLSTVPLFKREIVVDRIALIGVQLTLARSKVGVLRLGLESGTSGEDVLQRIRDAVQHRGAGGTSPLKAFAVRRARLAFRDEASGTFIVAPEADLEISTAGRSDGGAMTANLDARIEIAGKPARVFADFAFPKHGDLVKGDISVTGLDLGALARDGTAFSFLGPLALKADVTGSWAVENGTRLRYADFGIGAAGFVNGFGAPLHVKALRVVGRFDGSTGKLLIDDATLAGEQASAHLTGSADLKTDSNGAFTGSLFSIAVDRIGVNLPGAMQGAVTRGHTLIRGAYTDANKTVLLDQVQLSGGPLSATLAGHVVFSPNRSPEIDLDGKMDQVAVRDLLAYWPYRFVPGARAWIADNVSAGRIGPVLIHTRLPPGAIGQPVIPEQAVLVNFPLAGGTITYLRGLTPLTNVAGSAVLSGDTFKATIDSGNVGPLSVSQGKVTIANLHIHGTPVIIDAHTTGQLPQYLSLIDMKPLQYPTRFHINMASAAGNAAFDLLFGVPTIKNVPIDTVGISVKGPVNGVTLALGAHTHISDGTLNLNVDNAQLRATGAVTVGTARVNVDWTELFKPAGPISTRVNVKGTLDDAARASLGLPAISFLSGPVDIDAQLQGRRAVIRQADLTLNLTHASLVTGFLDWKKNSGAPATAHVVAQLDDSGSLRSADLTLAGPALSANGTATFASGGALESLVLPSVHAGALNDFGLTIRNQPGAGPSIAINGRSLDASGFGRKENRGATTEKTPPSNEPFHLTVKLDKLALREGVTLSPFALDAGGLGRIPQSLSVSGKFPENRTLSASIVTVEGKRRLTISAGDAGLLLKGLLGYSSVKGGQLDVQANMPATPSDPRKPSGVPDYAGELTIKDCTLVNQPFMARAVTAGSPGGLFNLMSGNGIGLDTVRIPFRISGDIVDIHDARASGPSIGITAEGYIDRQGNQVALQGAIAPMYGINGLLGNIPIIGDILTSKKGEGIVGMTYTLRGDLDQPTLSTNPLSVLTP
ncbi:MAG TPA: AsmA-like C-terminal domain-containing protein, partial [Rhizomicrobium sp.]|nr:AsmA-like C-terminal domain-containing protein [Rhizomicrobium sp.]